MSPEPDEFGPPEPIAPKAATLRAFDVASVKGIPILGPLTTRGDAAADAALDVARAAVSGPESVTSEHPKGMMEFLRNQYQKHLQERQGEEARLAAESPTATKIGHGVGNVAGYAALPGAAMATLPAAMATTGGVSALDEAVRGGSLGDIAGAGLGGAAGGAAGYGIGKALTGTLGKLADWQAVRAMGGTTAPAFKNIANISKNLELEPGGLARVGREQGIVGGLKKLSDVSEAAGAAKGEIGEQFGNLISKADETGKLIPVNDIVDRVGEIATRGVRPKYLKAAQDEARAELAEMAGPGGQLTHGQLQEWLSQRAEQASGIAGDIAKKANVSANDRAFYAIYKAGRDVQDKGLAEAVGEAGAGARDMRRLMTLNRAVEGIAQNRSQMLAAQHPLGLTGTLGAIGGLQQITSGNLKVGVPLLAMSLAGKATAPYRANVLTSALSGAQGGLQRLGAGEVAGLPTIGGANLGADIGEWASKRYLGKKAAPAADDFGPPEPIPQLAGRTR